MSFSTELINSLIDFFVFLSSQLKTTREAFNSETEVSINGSLPHFFGPRTKTIFKESEYTDGGDITATYVSVARASASIGSNSFEDTMM